MKRALFIILIIMLMVVGFSLYKYFQYHNSKNIQQNLTLEDNIKDCGTEIDKEGATHTLNKDCFIESFNNCSVAKIYKELYPPNNTIKTTVYVDGKEGDKCRIRVIVENKQVLPEKDNYYCYKAKKVSLDDSGEIRYLEISDCGNKKPLII